MQIIKKIKHDEKSVEFHIKGMDESFGLMIQEILLDNKDVLFASSNKDHPLIDEIRFFLKTKSKSPEEVLKKSIDIAIENFKDFKKIIKK